MSLDDPAAALRRSMRRRRIRFFVVLGCLVAAPFLWIALTWYPRAAREAQDRAAIDARRARREAYPRRPLSTDEAQQLQQLARSAKQTVADNHARWSRATAPGALAAVHPTDGCSPTISDPIAADVTSLLDAHRDADSASARASARPGYSLYPAGTPIPDPDAALDIATAEQAAARVAAGILVRSDFDHLRALTAPMLRIFLVTTQHTKARIAPERRPVGYIPGRIAGTAYLYRGGIVCAVPIDVQNSSTLEIRYPAFFSQLSRQDERAEQLRATQEALDHDIDDELRLTLKASLLAQP